MTGKKSPEYLAWLQTPQAKRIQKRRDFLRSQGIPGLIDATEVQEVIRRYCGTLGVTRDRMAEATGVSVASLQHHYRGWGPKGPIGKCRRDFRDRIMRGVLTLTEDDYVMPAAVGVRRRVQALVAAGYTFKWQAAQYGQDTAQVHAFAHHDSLRTKGSFARLVWGLYDKHSFRDPSEVGLEGFPVTYARTVARKNGWADPACWDEDSIDDPLGIPEWTGACGTMQGYRIHRREDIPLCPECNTARLIERRYPQLQRMLDQ